MSCRLLKLRCNGVYLNMVNLLVGRPVICDPCLLVDLFPHKPHTVLLHMAIITFGWAIRDKLGCKEYLDQDLGKPDLIDDDFKVWQVFTAWDNSRFERFCSPYYHDVLHRQSNEFIRPFDFCSSLSKAQLPSIEICCLLPVRGNFLFSKEMFHPLLTSWDKFNFMIEGVYPLDCRPDQLKRNFFLVFWSTDYSFLS